MAPNGAGRIFVPTNPDLANILGRTDLDFDDLVFLDLLDPTFLDFQVPRYPKSQISRFPDFQVELLHTLDQFTGWCPPCFFSLRFLFPPEPIVNPRTHREYPQEGGRLDVKRH